MGREHLSLTPLYLDDRKLRITVVAGNSLVSTEISQLTNEMLRLAWPKACDLKQQLRETWDSHSMEPGFQDGVSWEEAYQS